VQSLAAQIEEAIGEPQIFRVVRLAEYRYRQLLGFRQHLDLGGVDLNVAGREFGIDRTRRSLAHLAVDPHDPFRAQPLGGLEGGRVGIDDDLGQAVVVAQVDEQQAAVVAHPVDPAGKARGRADVALPQRPAGVRAVTVHAVVGHGRVPLRGQSRHAKSVWIRPEKRTRCRGCQGRARRWEWGVPRQAGHPCDTPATLSVSACKVRKQNLI